MKELKFKVGADPEFTYVSNNIRYSALEVMTKFCKLPEKFHTGGREMGYMVENAGSIGWDGHNASGEIRPKESNKIEEIVNNMEKLFAEAHKCMPIAEMKTTSQWMAIGGHIHLESTKFDNKNPTTKKIIQRALASLAIPVFANENPINVEIRTEKGTGYGDILDARTNGITYEFRPLTAEWTTTKEIARATLAYMAVIWNEITERPEEIAKYAEIIAKTDKQARAMQSLIVDEYDAITEGLISKIKGHVRKFELYPDFKDECELIFNSKKVKAIKEKIDFDIVKGWGLQKEEENTPSIKEIINDKKTQEKLASINLDEIIEYQQIEWKSDRNMEKVARKIGDTMLAWNWQMNNRYYFYALPKGIDEPIITNGKDEFIKGEEIIKTKTDYYTIKNIIKDAKSHFEVNTQFKRKIVNLKTGQIETDEEKSILIGVPYKTKEKDEGMNELFEIIYRIEKNKIKRKIIENENDFDTDIEAKEGTTTIKVQETKKQKTHKETNSHLENDLKLEKIITETRPRIELETINETQIRRLNAIAEGQIVEWDAELETINNE